MKIRVTGLMVAFTAGISCLVVVSTASGQDKAGPSAAKLSKMLEQYPDADANKDGTLTAEEARAYLQGKRGPGKGGFGLGKGGPGPGPRGVGDRAQMLKMHPEWDTNADGSLSDEEIQTGRSAMWGMSREEVAAKILEKHPEADTDGDGKLSPEEFAAFHRGRPGGPPVAPWAGLDHLIERFAQADLDGDGQLSKEELIKFRQQFGPPPGAGAGRGPGFGPRGDRPFPEQARVRMLENHPEADTDKDGKISDAEMKTFWEQNRGKLGLGKGPADKPGKGLGEGKGRQGKGPRGGQGAAGQQ